MSRPCCALTGIGSKRIEPSSMVTNEWTRIVSEVWWKRFSTIDSEESQQRSPPGTQKYPRASGLHIKIMSLVHHRSGVEEDGGGISTLLTTDGPVIPLPILRHRHCIVRHRFFSTEAVLSLQMTVFTTRVERVDLSLGFAVGSKVESQPCGAVLCGLE
jgi:hypothetical protein